MDNVPWFKGAVKVHNFLVRNYMSKFGFTLARKPFSPARGGWGQKKSPAFGGAF